MDTIAQQKINGVTVKEDFLSKVLRPYREHSKYLKKAMFSFNEEKEEAYPTLKGYFGINDSCYIDDTGHFNAVEYNICFNQMVYTYLGYCIREGFIPELEGFSKNNGDVFFEKQLSHFLIVNIQSSYKKPIDPKNFYGELGISMISKKANCTFIKLPCKYYDDGEGKSFGEITLAILHP